MTTEVIVVDTDVPGQTLIEQYEDGVLVARSWAQADVPVEARLNPDAPPATDMREGANGETISWAMPSAETWRLMTGTDEGRDAFRDAMIAAGRDVSREV